MGRYKKELVDPDIVYEPNDVTLINQTINSSVTEIVKELQTSPRYEDYIYNKQMLDTILCLIGPKIREKVKVKEVFDDHGDFLCWKISRIPKRYLKAKPSTHKPPMF